MKRCHILGCQLQINQPRLSTATGERTGDKTQPHKHRRQKKSIEFKQ